MESKCIFKVTKENSININDSIEANMNDNDNGNQYNEDILDNNDDSHYDIDWNEIDNER